MFWTWAASAGSLNALGAVAGAGVSVILGGLDMDFFGVDFIDDAFGEDARIDANGNDGRAIAEKNACGLDTAIVLGRGPKIDLLDVPEAAVTAGVVVTAALEGSGTIRAIGARRGADEEGANSFIISEVVGSSGVAAVGGSFDFECCCMSFARLADA